MHIPESVDAHLLLMKRVLGGGLGFYDTERQRLVTHVLPGIEEKRRTVNWNVSA